jgi:hypothetical protein
MPVESDFNIKPNRRHTAAVIYTFNSIAILSGFHKAGKCGITIVPPSPPPPPLEDPSFPEQRGKKHLKPFTMRTGIRLWTRYASEVYLQALNIITHRASLPSFLSSLL